MRIQLSFSYCRAMLLIILFVSLTFYVSCASTHLVATWKDKNFSSGPFKKIVVIGIFKMLENRKNYENTVVRALKEHGNKAIASLTFMKPDIEYKYEEMENIFNKQEIDGILLIRIKGINKKEDYYPPVEILVPEDTDEIYFDHYLRFYRVLENPGYLEETDIFRIECTLYSNENDRMVWIAEAKTIESDFSGEEPLNSSEDGAELANLIVTNLENDNFIK